MRIEHMPQALDTTQSAPTIDAVAVEGVTYQVLNSAWSGGQLSLAVQRLSNLDMDILLTLGAVDDMASILRIVFDEKEHVELRECYMGEEFQVHPLVSSQTLTNKITISSSCCTQLCLVPLSFACLQVTLLQRSIWNTNSQPTPSLVPMTTDGVYGGRHTGMHVLPSAGCVDSACRSWGWTVQYSLVVLIPDDPMVLANLHEDAQVISGYIRNAYEEHLMSGERVVNVQVTMAGHNNGYHVDAQV
jgi:hypothetical protein